MFWLERKVQKFLREERKALSREKKKYDELMKKVNSTSPNADGEQSKNQEKKVIEELEKEVKMMKIIKKGIGSIICNEKKLGILFVISYIFFMIYTDPDVEIPDISKWVGPGIIIIIIHLFEKICPNLKKGGKTKYNVNISEKFLEGKKGIVILRIFLLGAIVYVWILIFQW